MPAVFADATVRFVSWNVHGLGWPLDLHFSPFSHVPRKGTRIPNVIKLVGARQPRPDFIALQEIWSQRDAEFAERELTGLGYTVNWGGSRTGLLTAVHSAWTVATAKTVEYETKGANSDKLKHKGFQFVVIDRQDLPSLILFNTHLQSQYGKNRYEDVRGGQIDELTRAALELKAQHPNAPLLVCGDFNTFPYPVDWKVYSKISNAPWSDLTVPARAKCGCETNFDGRTPTSMESWIDYVLFLRDPSVRVAADIELLGNRRIDDPFSDHQGLSATVALRSLAFPALSLAALAVLADQPSRRLWLTALGALAVDAIRPLRANKD